MKFNLEPGHCWLSGTPCFEVLEVYESSHPLAGHVKRIGAPTPQAFKVDLLLMDGSTAHITIHESCLEDVKDRLNEIWHSIIERTCWEWKKKDKSGSGPKSDAQLKEMIEVIARKTLDNPPVGIVGINRWVDIR